MVMNKKNIKKIALALTSAITLSCNTVVKAEEKELLVRALDYVNIRSESSIESDKIGLLEVGSKLKYISETKEFYEVEYNNQKGYVSKDYSELIEQDKDYDNKKMGIVLSDTLMYTDIGPVEVEKYTIGEVTEENDLLYYFKTDNGNGYVYKDCSDILTDTYVIVDISDQELKLYEKDKLLLSTPVVTGQPSKGNDTDQGYFQVFQIRHNTDLVGPGYRSHVDVMMKFHNNEGIHDADRWRKEYGGEIYKTNGSHGCVNTPHDAAIEVSKHVELGTRVLVKE